MEIVTEEQAAGALKYLAETDVPHARTKALAKALEHNLKVVRSIEFIQAEGTVAEREAISYASKAYKDKVEEWQNAVADYEIMDNKRQRAILTIEMYRTVSANQRKGNI